MIEQDFNDYLNNDFLKSYQNLLPKNTPKTIYVYVEGDDDIAFWRKILMSYENKNRIFEINTPTQKDKTHALAKIDQIIETLQDNSGDYLLVCVDSDYDYLLGDEYTSLETKAKADKLNKHKYTFQTYIYATENYKCYAPTLKALCTQITFCDTQKMDFEAFCEEYSKIIYPLFLWNLFFYAKDLHNNYTIENFWKDAILDTQEKIKDLKTNQFDKIFEKRLENLDKKIQQKIKIFENHFPNYALEIPKFAKRLQKKGLKPENVYLFVRGHDLFDMISEILRQVCDNLKTEKEHQIKSQVQRNKIKDELDKYKNQMNMQTGSFEIIVRHNFSNNYNFQNCPFYQRISQNLKNIFP